jgi:hypothetical protein
MRGVPTRSTPKTAFCNSGLYCVCIGSYRWLAARIERGVCWMLPCSETEGPPSSVLNAEVFYTFGLIRIHTECYCIVTVRPNHGLRRMLTFRYGQSWPVPNTEFSNNSGLWRMPSSGMWRRVDLVWTDVSEERIASIFRVEKSANQEPASAGGCRLQKTAFFIVTAVKTSNLT